MTQEEYANRRFVIFNVTELPLIDFNQVYETSIDTIRKSVDGTQTFTAQKIPFGPVSFPPLPHETPKF
jgi:hypothetical protein